MPTETWKNESSSPDQKTYNKSKFELCIVRRRLCIYSRDLSIDPGSLCIDHRDLLKNVCPGGDKAQFQDKVPFLIKARL